MATTQQVLNRNLQGIVTDRKMSLGYQNGHYRILSATPEIHTRRGSDVAKIVSYPLRCI